MNVFDAATVWILAKRELRSAVFGIGVYLAILTSLIISSIILQNILMAVSRDRMLIIASPFSYPLFVAAGACTIYLAISAATSIARERDSQTLELLFYGPVNHSSYIFSKYLKGVLTYLFIILFLSIYFISSSLISNLGLSFRLLGVLILSFFLSSCVISFGILISTLTENVRTSILFFLGIVGGLIAIQITLEILANMGETSLHPAIRYLINTLGVIHAVVKWISPFYYLNEGLDAVSSGSAGRFFLSGITSIIYTAVMLLSSVFALKGKGVRKTTGE